MFTVYLKILPETASQRWDTGQPIHRPLSSSARECRSCIASTSPSTAPASSPPCPSPSGATLTSIPTSAPWSAAPETVTVSTWDFARSWKEVLQSFARACTESGPESMLGSLASRLEVDVGRWGTWGSRWSLFRWNLWIGARRGSNSRPRIK